MASAAGSSWRQKQLIKQQVATSVPLKIDAATGAPAEIFENEFQASSPSDMVIRNLDTGAEITIRDVKAMAPDAAPVMKKRTGKLGFLMKKSQDKTTLGFKREGKFQKRWFTLKDGVFSYFGEDKTSLKKVYPSYSRPAEPGCCSKAFEFYISVPHEDPKEDDPKEILVTLKASSASDMKSWIEALDSHSESLNRSLGPDLEFASKIESVTQGSAFEGMTAAEVKEIIIDMTEDEAAEAWQNFRDELLAAGFKGFDIVKEKHLQGFNAREPISAMFDVALYGSISEEVIEFTGNQELADLDYFLGWKSGFQGRNAIKAMKKSGEDKYSEAVLTDVFLCGLRDRLYKMCMISGSATFALNMDKVNTILFNDVGPTEFDAGQPEVVITGDTMYDDISPKASPGGNNTMPVDPIPGTAAAQGAEWLKNSEEDAARARASSFPDCDIPVDDE